MNHIHVAIAGAALGVILHGVWSHPHGQRFCHPHILPRAGQSPSEPPTELPGHTSAQIHDRAIAGGANAPGASRIPPPAWQLWAQDHGCSESVLGLIQDTCAEYSTDGVDMPALVAAVALPESSYNVNCSYKGHLGLMQVSTQHKAAFKRAGLDIYSETDRLTWSCQTIRSKLDKGKGLSAALSPWAETRSKALRNYYQMVSAGEVK